MPNPPMVHTNPPVQQQRAKLHADVGLTDFAITIHAPQYMAFRLAKGRLLCRVLPSFATQKAAY